MNGADWVIVAVVLLSTVQAAYAGFFQEAFHLAGLVAGYLLAAWQYQRVGRLAGEVSEVSLAGRERGLPDYFFCSRGSRRYGRPDCPLDHEEVRSQFCGPASGWGAGVAAGLPDCGGHCGDHDSVYAQSSKWLAGSEWAPYFQAVGRAAIWVAPAELRARFYQGLDLLRRMPQTVPGGVLPPPAPAK